MLECGTGGVKVGLGALCASPRVCMCVSQGGGRRGGFLGRLSMALTPPGGAE